MLTIVESLQLFSDKRLMSAKVVAMLSFRGYDERMVTLALRQDGEETPHIIALWIDIEARHYPQHLEYGATMLRLLSDESQQRHNRHPAFVTVTPLERDVCDLAIRQGVHINARHVPAPGMSGF